ncbi:MAG: L,D-transpeptidase family protein [Devosia sp.]
MDWRLFSQLGRLIVTAIFLRKLGSAIILLWVIFGLVACGGFLPKSSSNRHNQPLHSDMVAAIKAIGSTPGDAMVVRIFKQEQVLEVWKRTSAGPYKMLKSYPICAFSGDLGPKIQEGDRQSPEGFYTITPGLMNPKSSYYLAFNTGFPNKFDRVMGRTGSQLMVHGDCSSRGCYAMTDEGIAEIYALARESFKGGNTSFQLQIFPFRMTGPNLAKQSTSPNLAFWKDIKEGYDLFEVNQQPPAWDVCERQYIFNASGGGALNPMGACPVTTKSAALLAKQQADDKAFDNSLAAEARQANETAVIKARGELVNGAVSGAVGNLFGGLGGLLGGGEQVTPVMTGQIAPIPYPPLKR